MTVSRRRFLGQISTTAALALVPKWAMGAQPPLVPAPPRKLGVALVGLGNYSRGQLGPALRRTRLCRLAGVVTGDVAKGARWAQEYGFSEKAIYGYDTMARIAENPDIDIVYVVTPPGLHAAHAIAAAKTGKHVLCEKPMANSVAECDAILAACAAAKVRLGIGYRLFFDPYHSELRRLAKTEEFGVFKQMTGRRAFRMNEWRWRADKKLGGGGPLMDLGVYLIQGACMAKNGVAPVAVTAQEKPKQRPDIFRDVEETIAWTMEFADGAAAEFFTSYQDGGDNFRAEGARGWIEFKSRAFGYQVGEVVTSRGPLDFGPRVNQQALHLDAFASDVLAGRPHIASGEMGRRDLTIIEAIYRAAQSGQREIVRG